MTVKRDSQRTRARIAGAALREFSKKGFDGARVDAIAARAKVSVRMIYHYFGDKNGLYQAVLLDRMGDRKHESLEWSADVAGIPQEHYSAIRGDSQFVRLMQWEALTFGAGDGKLTDEEHRLERYAKLVEQLGERQRAGLLRSDISPEMILMMIIAVTSYPLSFPQVARMVTGMAPSSPEFEQSFEHVLSVFGTMLSPAA